MNLSPTSSMESRRRIGGMLSHITPTPTASVDDIPVIDTHQHMWYSCRPTPPQPPARDRILCVE